MMTSLDTLLHRDSDRTMNRHLRSRRPSSPLVFFLALVLAFFQGFEAHAEKSADLPKGKVFFANLKDGEKISPEADGKILVKFGVKGMALKKAGDPSPHSGHHHLLIDRKFIEKDQMIPAEPNSSIHFGGAQTQGEIPLSPGTHTLVLQFGDANHKSYGEPWSASVTIEVLPMK